ncbi:cytochrome P450 [Podospora aff. communis PSN243]|uniref:Cytochrome P450 n=1 Tax=Podospora aff. communis PSN243 TaxID=3040156 RepID=A0AAV9GSU9_9PEZI|nr:cytochrome P450 [Podospora aff. communis PSN243]
MQKLSYPETLVAVIAPLITYLIITFIRVRLSYHGRPKPPHSFLWGHLKVFKDIIGVFPPNTHPQFFYTELAKRYNLPGIWYLDLWPFGPAQVIITSAEASFEVLSKRPYLMHRWVDYWFRIMLGPNVIAAINGPAWKKLHHMMGPSFSPVAVKAQVPVIARHAALFHENLCKVIKTGKPFSMVDITSRATSDIISDMVLGFSLKAQQNGSPLLQDFKTIFTLTQPYMDTWNPIRKAMLWWKIRGAKQRTDAYLHSVLDARYQLFRENSAIPSRKSARSVLDRMVIQRIEEMGDSTPLRLDQPFIDLVTPNLKGLLAGGQSTTSDALCHTHLLLSLHPAILTRLRKEHSSLFPPSLAETVSTITMNPALTSASSLPYTTAILQETLRLFPAGFTSREAPPDVTHLIFDGVSYPVQGKMIIPHQHALHYDEKQFPNPTEFLPERFMPEYTGSKAHRFAWRPFERGLRSCIGKELAMEEMRIVLVCTVRWFDFEGIFEGVMSKGEGKVMFSDWDERIGESAWQEMALGAAPRGGMMMRGVYRGEEGEGVR